MMELALYIWLASSSNRIIPPERYVYDRPGIVEMPLDYKTLSSVCEKTVGRKPPKGWTWGGCSDPRFKNGKCIARYLKGDRLAKEHEIAHCNGWRHKKYPK